MKTDADRVRFAVRFAYGKNPMALSDRALSKLQNELAAFLGFTGVQSNVDSLGRFGVHVTVLRAPWPWEYPKLQLHQLQEDTQQLLESTIEGRGFNPTTISDGKDGQPLRADVVIFGDERVLRIAGSVRAGFLLTLLYLMQGPAEVPVLKCPVCGRVFVRVRRQKYCRRECANKANWEGRSEEDKQRYRKTEYAKHGWELGAHSKKKQKGGN